MTGEFIEVTGARENNLRNVSVRAKRAVTAYVAAQHLGRHVTACRARSA